MQTSMHRDLRSSHAVATSSSLGNDIGDRIFLSIPGMPNEAVLKRVRIMTGDLTLAGTEKLNIRALSDPARWRAAEAIWTGSGESKVIFALGLDTSETSPNEWWLEDTVFSDDIIYTDDLKSGCFHIMLEAGSTLTDTAYFSVEVFADGLPTHLSSQDSQHFLGARDLQVLRWSTGDVWKDMTRDSFNALDEDGWQTSMFLADSDYVYFGSPDPITGLYFNVAVSNTQVDADLTTEFYDGSTWTSFSTLYDNCTDANNDSGQEIKFHHTGVITWEPETTWRKASLGDLSLGSPPYDRGGSESYIPDSHWEPKYWMRMNLDDVDPQAKFKWIRREPFI
jgi:hypothetical protein